MTRRYARRAVLLGALLAVLARTTSTALATAPAAGPPQWAITSVAGPAHFKPNSSEDLYVVSATNVGGVATSGPITIEDSLHGKAVATAVERKGEVTEKSTIVKGLSSTTGIFAGGIVSGTKVAPETVVSRVFGEHELELSNPIEGAGSATLKENLTFAGVLDSTSEEFGAYGDAFTRHPLSCALSSPSSIKCAYAGRVDVGDVLTFAIKVNVTASEGEQIKNTAKVEGGGAASASTSEPTTKPTPVSSEPVHFGVASLFTATSTAQAGAHPNFTTSFTPNWGEVKGGSPLPPAALHEVGTTLPPGLSGDPLAVPTCDIFRLRRQLCPEEDAVGVANTRTQGSNLFTALVYRITPYPDEPAAFAFTVDRAIATGRIDTSVVPNANGEYAVRASVPEINDSEAVLSSSVTLWGTPAQYNGPGEDKTTECDFAPTIPCVTFGGHGKQFAQEQAFMRNPTSCAGPLAVGFEIDSWSEPGALVSDSSPLPTQGECGLLSPLFKPALTVAPDTTQAGAPSGYGVNLELAQNESAQSLATPDLKDSSVTLPEGTVASPSAANGLEACSDAQFQITSVKEAECPKASEIGKVKIKTPLLTEELTGKLFVGQPECSPCGQSEAAEGKMLRLFLQARLENPAQTPEEQQKPDVLIKLAGRTHVNEQNGQLTTVFESSPQQPFEKLTLHTDGGPGAPLANPSTCGPAKTTSKLVPWSSTAAEPFAEEPSSSFEVTGCAAPQFAPAFSAGVTSTASAGAYSPLSVTFSRTDQDQIFGGVTTQTPPGLLGAVSHVMQCGEPQASQGACGPESQIGTVATAAGPGPTPFWITGGRAYLTGPYHGAPFGLSIVVPTVAGPFNLGEEHLRARILVDPYTSAITVVSDPLPTMKDGIPFQVKTVNVNINRPQFTFNATSCKPMAIGATISSTQGAAARVSSPYQAHGCASLPFSPELTAEAGGHGSKANGTSFIVKVKPSPGQANIAKTFLQLPIALPSRLDTIQKACPAATFEANPASCDEGSNIGMGIARTPLLKSAVVGPAYLVSHGNAGFPDVEFVLQGEGITLILDGKTDIKSGITYSRFETVPDAPVSTFEAVLPAGPHSALAPFVPGAERYNLCNTSLVMPTEITAQNGAVIKQTTHVAVTGCAAGKPSVKIAKVKVSGNALLVTFKTGATGTVRVSGYGLITTRKNLTAGTHQVRVAFTKLGVRRHKRHKRTSVRVKLVVGAQADTKDMTVRL